MVLAIELTSEQREELTHRAATAGIAPEEYARRLVMAHLSSKPDLEFESILKQSIQNRREVLNRLS